MRVVNERRLKRSAAPSLLVPCFGVIFPLRIFRQFVKSDFNPKSLGRTWRLAVLGSSRNKTQKARLAMKNRRFNLPMVSGSLANKTTFSISFTILLLAATSLTSQAQNIWLCGTNDNAWPLTGTGGGPAANFVQEAGGINPLPGSPDSTPVSGGADNDYYFAGIYTNVIASVTALYGDYTPVGDVPVNEDSAER